MPPADIILDCKVEDLNTLHSVLDALESEDVESISVSISGYVPGSASKVMAFCTGCALRSRRHSLNIYGRKLVDEVLIGDAPLSEELAAIDSSWARVSAELQILRPHDVAVNMSSMPGYFC